MVVPNQNRRMENMIVFNVDIVINLSMYILIIRNKICVTIARK